jgi:hypothetical protein
MRAVGDNGTSRRRVGFRLGLIGAGDAGRIRRRIGVPVHARVGDADERTRSISS